MPDPFECLGGKSVEQIWAWGPVRLVFELGDRPEPEAYVDIWKGRYIASDGTTSPVDVARDPEQAGRILRLLQETVANAGADDEGLLRLDFANGPVLIADPDERYETWCVVCGGRAYQCLPGGDIGLGELQGGGRA